MSVGKKKTSTFLSEQLEGSGWWDKDKEIEVADGQGVVKFMKGGENWQGAKAMAGAKRQQKAPHFMTLHIMTPHIKITNNLLIVASLLAAELLDKMRKQESFAEKVMQSADGRLISEDSGKITLDELEKSEQHQHLKAFMALGRFGHIMLRSVGYAEGNVTNIKTSPRYMPPSDAVDTNHKIPNLLILSVDNGEHYELEFEFDLKYLRGFAMVAGWRLDKKGAERAKDLVLPAPEMEPVLFGYRIKDLEDFSKKFGR